LQHVRTDIIYQHIQTSIHPSILQYKTSRNDIKTQLSYCNSKTITVKSQSNLLQDSCQVLENNITQPTKTVKTQIKSLKVYTWLLFHRM